MRDAFGIVAMVAMTPLITIQLLGLVYSLKMKRKERVSIKTLENKELIYDNEVIDL